MTSSANATQVGGAHYKAEYQHWDFVWDCQMGYFPGQITKYLYRWRAKNGVQDLKKALHFAQKYAELGAAFQATRNTDVYIVKFVTANPRMGALETLVIMLLGCSHDAITLKPCVAAIELLIGREQSAETVADGSHPTSRYVAQ